MTKNFILVCDSATFSNNKLDVTGVFDSIFAPNFPATHPRISIVVNLETSPEERNIEHIETFKIFHNDEEFAFLSTPFTPTGIRHQFVHNLEQLVLPAAGKYIVQISVDNTVVGETYFMAERI